VVAEEKATYDIAPKNREVVARLIKEMEAEMKVAAKT